MNGNLKFYMRLLVRRAPVMLLLLLVSTAIGGVLAIRLPTTYETAARLIVQPQQISEDLAASTVQINALEEVRFLQEQLLTRANLLEIADEYDVFENPGTLVPNDIVDTMRASTRIEATGGTSRRTGPQPVLVAVQFRARSPEIAANVVNEYVTRLLAESARQRAGAAGDTLEFFEQEVERLGIELNLRSSAITEFQNENSDALPDDQEFRLRRLLLLQERLTEVEADRRSLEDTRERTIEVFEASGSLGLLPEAQRSPEEQELVQLERELSQALTTFSETAPQVQLLQRRIEALRGEVAAQLSGGQAGFVQGEASGPDAILALQLSEIDSQLEAFELQVTQIETEITQIEAAVARTPLNSITLASLERDYENVRLQYDNAVQRLAQASIGERIEVSARGQRISLIEPAAVPSSPASPNRPLLAMGGFGVGLALAGAFFVLMELLNSTVRRPVEISNRLGITPLAVLPYIESRRERLMRRFFRVAAALLVLGGVPAALWAIDTYYLPLDLVAERIFGRLGLG